MIAEEVLFGENQQEMRERKEWVLERKYDQSYITHI
jgi:hypothetical protein